MTLCPTCCKSLGHPYDAIRAHGAIRDKSYGKGDIATWYFITEEAFNRWCDSAHRQSMPFDSTASGQSAGPGKWYVTMHLAVPRLVDAGVGS